MPDTIYFSILYTSFGYIACDRNGIAEPTTAYRASLSEAIADAQRLYGPARLMRRISL